MSPKEIRQSATEQLRAVDRDSRTVDIVASTFDLDSYGTRIDPNGWDLEAFKKNPVICLQHDDRGYTGSNGLPVANAIPESIRIENNRLVMRIRFPEAGKFDVADTVWSLVSDGFLRGVSVGFEPLAWEDVQEEEGKDKVRIYRKQRLLETSLVTIPSNDNALVQRAKNLNADESVIRRMTEQLEAEIREEVQNPEHRWVAQAQAVADVLNMLSPECEAYKQIQKLEKYFEAKQPINRVASKALEKFYKHILQENLPEDEKEAWERMASATEKVILVERRQEEEEKPEEPKPEPKTEDKPEEKKDETPAAEPEVTKVEVTPEEPDDKPSIPSPPAEAPQDEPKASVQLSIDVLKALPKVGEALARSAVEALRQGVPRSELGGVLDNVGRKLTESLLHP